MRRVPSCYSRTWQKGPEIDKQGEDRAVSGRRSSSEHGLDRAVERARAALAWEMLWPPLARFGVVVLAFLAASWFGLWSALPPWGRPIGLAVFAIAALYALLPLAGFRMPSRARGVARIDRDSGGTHRPATALVDDLAGPGEDPVTRALWQAHRDRARAAARDLRVGLPAPGLPARDPRAFRFLALILAIVAFFAAGQDRAPLIASAFDWQSQDPLAAPPRLDAWVTPPPYTGRPPIFLTAAAAGGPGQDAAVRDIGRVHNVPAGSTLVVRSGSPEVVIEATGGAERVTEEGDAAAPRPPAGAPAGADDVPAALEARFTLKADAGVTARPERGEAQEWRFAVTPDAPPTIAFAGPPTPSERGALNIAYTLGDDYGVAAAHAEVAPVGEGGAGMRPLYGPPEIRLPLPQARTREATLTTSADVSDHPWAGSRVAITLLARDEPGQTARSETVETRLPARRFTDPVARALVEQRRLLAMDAGAARRVERALDALTLFPERFTPSAGTYLGLRSAYWRLHTARSDEALRGVVDYLWEIALRIEDGDLPGTERDLRAAQEALREALERGASDEKIAKLMDELRAALQNFMQELARRAQQNQETGAPLPPNARILTEQDLKSMLDRMENLARGGNREAAQDLLAELNDMLNNLQTGQQGQMGEGEQAMDRALDELGRMIREQSELRDRTYQERQRQLRQQGEGEQGQPQGGENGDKAMGELGESQGALRQRLQELMKQMEGMGLEGDSALGEAGEAMGRAQGQLGEGQSGQAFSSQGDALDSLRQGAQGMAERMMQGQGEGQGQGQAGGQQPGQGRPGGRQAGAEDTDPLGRPTRSRRYDPGNSVRVPGEIEAQRARRVLEELRRRVSEPERSREELDYLDRLLRD